MPQVVERKTVSAGEVRELFTKHDCSLPLPEGRKCVMITLPGFYRQVCGYSSIQVSEAAGGYTVRYIA